MYKVIIVDDEILARVGIKSLISWREHGFELIGEYENGKQAYDAAKLLLPDIIITDVKMPVMSGIDLINELKSDGVTSKFIMLSSHDDFEFVKEAMKLGAEDYILKLQMEPEDLLKVLKIASKKIELENSEKKRFTYIEKQINDNLPVLKDKLLKDLIFGNNNNEFDIKERFKAYNINLPQEHIICLAVRIENMEMYNNYHKDEIYKLRFSFISIIEEIMLNYGFGYACHMESDLFAAVCSLKNDNYASSMNGSIIRITKDMKEFLKDSMNLKVTMGVSDIHRDYSDIKIAYNEAVEAIGKNFAFPPGAIIMYSDVKSIDLESDVVPLEMELKDLENSLKACNIIGIQKAFNIVRQRVKHSSHFSQKYITGCCHILIFIVNVFIHDNNISPEEIWGKYENPYNQVEQLKSLNDFIDWITQIYDNIINTMSQDKSNNAMILRAKQFINKHFCEDIFLEVVAEYLGLSPSYFSRLFSKGAGESFTDYVTNLRINFAKELLKSANYKVYEVAHMVGYDNTHYFSRIFKKVVGVAPFDFKANMVN